MIKGLLLAVAGVVLVTSILLINLNTKKTTLDTGESSKPATTAGGGEVVMSDKEGTIRLTPVGVEGSYEVSLVLPNTEVSAMAIRIAAPSTLPTPTLEVSAEFTGDEWSVPVKLVEKEGENWNIDLALVNLNPAGYTVMSTLKLATVEFGETVNSNSISLGTETQLIAKTGEIIPLKLEVN